MTKRPTLFLLSSVSLLGLAQAASAADAPATASTAVSEIVVTAAPREEVKARKVQQDAINLINVQSAETIAKYPDFNAAEALGRMPGVSISTDTGEGRFVNIRGIDGNLAGATFGGVPLLNTNPGGTYFGGGGRAVEFDTIPTGSVDGIILTKTTLPDHEAEGLGGTIELTPRTATNITKPFLDAQLGWGYENERDVTGPFDLDLAGGARFGFINGKLAVEGIDDTSKGGGGLISNPTPFSFVLTASRKDDRRGFDDIEEDYNTPYDRSYQDIQLRRYNYHRRRFGYGGEFDFKPNDDHSYYIRANVAGYTESVTKNRLTYDFSNYTPTANGTGFNSLADLSIKSTDEAETHRNSVYVIGGKDRFGDAVLDYRTSYSRATYVEHFSYGTTFNGPTGVATYYNNSANNGDFPILNVTDGTNVNNGALYSLKKNSVSNAAEQDVDEEYATAANFLIPVHIFNGDDRIKIGVEVRLRDKTSDPLTYGSVKIGPETLALTSDGVPPVTDFYGQYSNGPGVNTVAVHSAAAALLGPATTDPSGAFTARENIYSGYVQYSGKIDHWRFLVGARVEDTSARYDAFTTADGGNTYQPAAKSIDYTNVFPTAQVRYDFTPDFLVRATYSTGIGRPGFLQNTPSGSIDVANDAISQGNPNLKPTTGNNFDLSFEYYLPRGGIVQFGLFDKEFQNYIVTDLVRKLDTNNDVLNGDIVAYSTYSNASGAYARGGEFAYHQQYYWLPKPFDGFGIDANLTAVASGIREYTAATSGTTDQYGLLPGTSQLTWNLAGFYEAHGFQARISAEYVSKELFGLGGAKNLDTIQDSRLTADFTASYQILRNWKLYFAAKNLTNAPLRFYVNNPSFPIQREFYEQTFLFGIKAHF